jgi:hypothetical protein
MVALPPGLREMFDVLAYAPPPPPPAPKATLPDPPPPPPPIVSTELFAEFQSLGTLKLVPEVM